MAFPYCQLNRMSRCAQGIMGYCDIKNRAGRDDITTGKLLDQLANLHFHFTSVPRCTPMTD